MGQCVSVSCVCVSACAYKSVVLCVSVCLWVCEAVRVGVSACVYESVSIECVIEFVRVFVCPCVFLSVCVRYLCVAYVDGFVRVCACVCVCTWVYSKCVSRCVRVCLWACVCHVYSTVSDESVCVDVSRVSFRLCLFLKKISEKTGTVM